MTPDRDADAIVRRLSCSNLAAQFSEQMAIAAIPIVAVVALQATAQQAASLQAVNTLPFLLLSIPAGLLADRLPRGRLMIATELARTAALLALVALFRLQALSLGSLAALGFAVATGTVAYSVSAPALVAALVARDGLLAANRRLELARSVAYTAGPALGGILAGWAAGLPAFLLACLLSLASAALLARLPGEAPRAPSGRSLPRDLAEGVRFVAGNVHLRPIAATAFVFNTSWYLLLSVFAYDAVNRLAFDAAEVGAALGTYGFGMIAGALLHPRIAQRMTFGRQILMGPACAFAAALLMAATLAAPAKPPVFAAFFLFGFGPIVWTISTTSLRQVVTPAGMVARVSAFIMTATFGARPLGAALGAWLSGAFGAQGCLLGAAIGFGAQLGIIGMSASARLKTVPQPAAAAAPGA